MRKKKVAPKLEVEPATFIDSSIQQPDPPQEPEEIKPIGAERRTIAWYVNPDGSIQWDRMRSATKDELRKLLDNEQVLAELGAKPKDAPAPVEVFDPEWTGALYDSLGKIEQVAAIKIWKIDADIAGKVFSYTEAEKDKLRGPTTKVLNKYAAAWMIRFKDEIALFMLLATMTAHKIAMLNGVLQIQAQMEKNRAAAQAPAAAPVPVAETKPVEVATEAA